MDVLTPDSARRGTTRPGLARLISLLRPTVAFVVLGVIIYAVARQWGEVRSGLRSLAWSSVLLSLAAALAGTGTSLLAWRALLKDQGHAIPVAAAARIFLVGQLGKYLPGSVWSVVLQTDLARRQGLSRSRAFTTSLVWVGLSLSTALAVGLLGLPELAHVGRGRVWWLLLVLPVALVASAPPVLTVLVNWILRVLRKQPLRKPLTWSGVLSACGWLGLTWICFGLHLWLLADSLGVQGFGGLVRCVGGFSLAMAAGVLFVVVPSGAGVREAIIVAALAPVMSTGQALSVAVVSRAVFIVADLLSAGAAAVSGLSAFRAVPRSTSP